MAPGQTDRMNLALAAGLLIAMTASLPARADLTIVTEVNIARSGGPTVAETAALAAKGDNLLQGRQSPC